MPVLGRSAAGVPQFWSDPKDGAGLTTLAELVARHANRQPQRVRTGKVCEGGSGSETSVQLITLRAPDESDVVEFVSAPSVKSAYPDVFALRIDGDSMAPEICHGDLVLLSPSASAADGRAAVVQIRNQIGVTCKVYRREQDRVHLAAVNESFPPQTCQSGEIVWALRVLARVRT